MNKSRISDNNKTYNGSHISNHGHEDSIKHDNQDLIDHHHEDFIDEQKLSPMTVNLHRKLTIYTWGNKVRKTCPHQTDHDFNVRKIKRRKNGVKVNHRDGRVPAIQKMIINGRGFTKCLEEILDKIEKFNLTQISIYCAKGRHRSVSYAELLKKYYYPRATIHHLELLPLVESPISPLAITNNTQKRDVKG